MTAYAAEFREELTAIGHPDPFAAMLQRFLPEAAVSVAFGIACRVRPDPRTARGTTPCRAMTVTLSAIRSCFEGTVPSAIATCAADGTPNVALLSQVHYVDDEHVALSFQFFNKTRENVLANPRAVVQVMDPVSGAHFRLHLEYLRTETDGPLFENMKAKLAGIASPAHSMTSIALCNELNDRSWASWSCVTCVDEPGERASMAGWRNSFSFSRWLRHSTSSSFASASVARMSCGSSVSRRPTAFNVADIAARNAL